MTHRAPIKVYVWNTSFLTVHDVIVNIYDIQTQAAGMLPLIYKLI